jgi:hypothetical protein
MRGMIARIWNCRSIGDKLALVNDVARQGIDALLAGKDHVYAASFKTKLEGALANVLPGDVKGAMHEKMAKRNSEK